MSVITEHPFVFCAALLLLSFVAIFVLWFVERVRGPNAPQIATPAPNLTRPIA